MPGVCEVMKPGPHCVCYDGPDEECCYCTLGLANCKDDGPKEEDSDDNAGQPASPGDFATRNRTMMRLHIHSIACAGRSC